MLVAIWNIDKKSAVRHVELDEREYLVVPMSMILEGVHAGSQGPIYYSKAELSKTPKMWNMKPILVYHPRYGDTGTDLKIYKNQAVGMIMGAEWKNGKLKAEAWIDKEKAKKIEPDILEHIERGEPMEVSTGLFADCILEEGDWNGEPYTAVAQNIRADHLAILPNKDGACSIADGAGLLVNQAQQTQQAQQEEQQKTEQQKMSSVSTSDNKDIEFVLSGLYAQKAILKKMIEEATSDEERQKLQSQYDALDAEVKKFENNSIQNSQNEYLKKLAESIMSLATSIKTEKQTQVSNSAQTQATDNSATNIPVSVNSDKTIAENKIGESNTSNVTTLTTPIPTNDTMTTPVNKPKMWSFNTIQSELGRLVRELVLSTQTDDKKKVYAYVSDVFPERSLFVYAVHGDGGDDGKHYCAAYSIVGDAITIGTDRVEIEAGMKYTLPDGTILNGSPTKQNIPVNDVRTEGAKNSPETEAARRRIEDLRKRILDLTTKLYEITGRSSKENVLTPEDWRKVKEIQSTLDKAKAFVVKEMESVRGVAPVRHDNVLKSTKEELLGLEVFIRQLAKDYYDRLKKVG
jgi:hypothetical protein